jgi:hypothetical protein
MLVVIGTDYIGNSQSNYHAIKNMTAPIRIGILSVYIQFNIFNFCYEGVSWVYDCCMFFLLEYKFVSDLRQVCVFLRT